MYVCTFYERYLLINYLIHNDFLQSLVFIVILALGLFAGGIASAVNAANVTDDLDGINCDKIGHKQIREVCKITEQMRDGQVASAVSFKIYSG